MSAVCDFLSAIVYVGIILLQNASLPNVQMLVVALQTSQGHISLTILTMSDVFSVLET